MVQVVQVELLGRPGLVVDGHRRSLPGRQPALLAALALAAGDHDGATTELRTGLALWRGVALEGFVDEPWAQADAMRLEELRPTATEDLHDAALAGGAGAELVGDLTEGHARHPLRSHRAVRRHGGADHPGPQPPRGDDHDRGARRGDR